jgi:hypothetical protein
MNNGHYITPNDFLWNERFQKDFQFLGNDSLLYWEKIHKFVSIEVWVTLNTTIRDTIMGNPPQGNEECELITEALKEQQWNLT